MRIAFVLNDLSLSGGTNVVLQHASRLVKSHHHDVSLILREPNTHSWEPALLRDLHITPLSEISDKFWDIAIATYWETILLMGEISADSYIWFCQQYEDRFFPDRNPNVSTMQIAGAIPLPVITEAHWIKDLIKHENPSRSVSVVLNGIDKEIFKYTPPRAAPDGRLKVLVEGSLDALAKNTSYAIACALASSTATTVSHVGNRSFETSDKRYSFVEGNRTFDQMADLYSSHDVVLKTSRAEGFGYPPLEAMHRGTPFLSTRTTGIEEYARFGKNSLSVPWDNAAAVGATLDRLALEPGLWLKLHKNALRSAAKWPDWDTQAQHFETALYALAPESKLNKDDLRALSVSIQFGDLTHWLAIRRLSDAQEGLGLLEKHAAHAHSEARGRPGFLRRVLQKLRRLIKI